MRSRTAVLVAMLAMVPLGTKAADLVVWWAKSYYPQEDGAVRDHRRLRAGVWQAGRACLLRTGGASAQSQCGAGDRTAARFRVRLGCKLFLRPMGLRGSARDLSDEIIPFGSLFDPDALSAATLFDVTIGRRALRPPRWGSRATMSTSGATCSSRPGSPSMAFPGSGGRARGELSDDT